MTIILNFKTYGESEGQSAIELAEIAYNYSRENKHRVIICPQALDIENVLERFQQDKHFEVWAQHVDYQTGGKETGYVTVESLQMIGVNGSLVNHAEHKINEISNYADIKKGFGLCFCVSNLFELSLAFGRNPDFRPELIAYEPPELIGGDVSVAQANPDDIEKIIERFAGWDILVGAGIKNSEDVRISTKLGAKGVLISSGFIFAKDKTKFLTDLFS